MQYTDDSIQVLEGLDAVRKRPAMYIGSTDLRGLHQILFEIVDNDGDEELADLGETIKVTVHKDNNLSIEDNDNGIPVGMHSTGKPTTELIISVLHAGGKL